MSELTHTFTQTFRHYSSDANLIGVDDARSFGYPLLAECGQVWIPHQAHLTDHLPICPRCEGVENGPLRIAGRPHFVYRCFDADGRLIYVGCSRTPKNRMDQHRANSWWFEQVERVRFTVFPNKDYALWMERRAIETEHPRWNIRHRDQSAWELVDYRDHHLALTTTGASEKRLEKVRAEAQLRFGVDITDPERQDDVA